jgi:hypothetical protein
VRPITVGIGVSGTDQKSAAKIPIPAATTKPRKGWRGATGNFIKKREVRHDEDSRQVEARDDRGRLQEIGADIVDMEAVEKAVAMAKPGTFEI